jgi:hypothetical protein
LLENTWYKDAVFCELYVRAFADGNGDGIGDLCGLATKLDYLQWLGVDAVWLLPIFPSPQRDDGYDVSDYCSIHPDYSTLEDFRTLVAEAHGRGLRIMNFHFPLMPRIFMALARADRAPIEQILARAPPLPSACQWGIFLRCHDELTLEMVTPEERALPQSIHRSPRWTCLASPEHGRVTC